MIQAVHDGNQFLLAHQSQIAVFEEKLADEPVGVFVHSPLPGSIRMSKVDRGVKSPSHLGVLTKFSAIVIRDRMHRSLVWPKALGHRRPDRGSGLVRNALEHRILRAAFDQGHESSSMAMPDHGITLPVTNSLAIGHYRRTLVNGDLVRHLPAATVHAIALPPRFLTAQPAVKRSPSLFIPRDVLINPLMTNGPTVFALQATADLFRAPGLLH